jgi:hypothetical protein
MNCPHCQKPISKLSILTSLGGVRVCPECKKEYVVKYDYKTGAIVLLVGFVVCTVILAALEVSGGLTGLVGVALLATAALISGRAEKHGA